MITSLSSALSLESKGVTILGSSNMDYVYMVDEFPQEGTTISAKKFFKNPGGKGANQAIMIAKLDTKPRHIFVTAVGNDGDASNLLTYYSNHHLISPKTHSYVLNSFTSTALIMVDSQGKNRIIVNPGANLALRPESFISSFEEVKKHTKIFLTVLEIPVDTATIALEMSKKEGMFTILNPTPARSDFPDKMFQNTDLLCLNETEAEVICGISAESHEDFQKVFASLKNKGVGQVILTLGSKGSVHFDENGTMSVFGAEKVKAVDTTGAGDCFIGSVAYFLSCGVDIKLAIQFATKIAAMAVQKAGASGKYPKREDLVE